MHGQNGGDSRLGKWGKTARTSSRVHWGRSRCRKRLDEMVATVMAARLESGEGSDEQWWHWRLGSRRASVELGEAPGEVGSVGGWPERADDVRRSSVVVAATSARCGMHNSAREVSGFIEGGRGKAGGARTVGKGARAARAGRQRVVAVEGVFGSLVLRRGSTAGV